MAKDGLTGLIIVYKSSYINQNHSDAVSKAIDRLMDIIYVVPHIFSKTT